MSLKSVQSKMTSFGLSLALVLGMVSPIFFAEEASAISAGSGNCQQDYTASGTGTVSVYESGNYCYVAFKNTNSSFNTQTTFTWTRPANVTLSDVLVVGGGGGGGARHAGGGGAGAYVEATNFALSGSSITVVVGSGGNGAAGGTTYKGSSGQTSSFKSSANGLTALGGGFGSYNETAGNGGSGGGSGWSQTYGSVTTQSQTTLSGSPLTGITFGNEGRSGANEGDASYDYWAGGGGGGAGARGENPKVISTNTESTSFSSGIATNTRAGAGGIGKTPSWLTTTAANSLSIGETSGSSVYFAGGGGGGMGNDGYDGGAGGLGGGGNGTKAQKTGGIAGAAFTGGGGGSSGFDDISLDTSINLQNPPGGAGGSGVVLVRYAIPVSITITAANKTAIYTGSSVSVSNSFTYSGTLNGSDAISAVTYTYAGAGSTSYSASTTAPTEVGTYSITPSAAVFSSGPTTNYNITYSAGTLNLSYQECSPTDISVANSGYTIKKFTNIGNCNWAVPNGVTQADYLIIGGGGSGGAGIGGGGGAGEFIERLNQNVSGNIVVRVGEGGTSALGRAGGNGGNSVFNSVTANGGGGGGSGIHTGQFLPTTGNIGSGGGGYFGVSGATKSSAGSGFSNNGGSGSSGGCANANAGGGGGAGQAGASGTTTDGGSGGNGYSSSITGTSTTYAGGGGGGVNGGAGCIASGNPGSGGTGGGGNGGPKSGDTRNGFDAAANTGSGGGGASNLNSSSVVGLGGAGGSGLIIVKYVNAPSISLSSTTLSATVGNSISSYTLNNSGGPATYSISSADSTALASAGITFDTSNGTLSGTVSATLASRSITITATNTSGTSTASFTLSSNYAGCSPTDISVSGSGYTIKKFTNTSLCNWSVPAGITKVELLLVGGGGGGAGNWSNNANSLLGSGGAGGGGGVYTGSNVPVSGTITVKAGAGGSNGTGTATQSGRSGAQGGDSVFGEITAGGGGGGGCEATATNGTPCGSGATIHGRNGTAAGSGGSPSNFWNAYNYGNAGTATSVTLSGTSFVATSRSGNRGGYYNDGGSSTTGSSGSGGGAGGAGNLNTFGAGISSSITGSTVTYGAGGSSWNAATWGAVNPTANSGNGGNGAYNTSIAANGAPGADGIVIVKYISAANTPSLSSATVISTGFSFNVLNYDSNYTYSYSASPTATVTPGTASGSTLPITVSGLSAGQSSTITVSTSANGFTASTTVTGNAKSAALTPAFGTISYGSGTVIVPVTNYDANYTFTPSVTYSTGTGTISASTSGSVRTYTITPGTFGATVSLTVATTRDAYLDGTATTSSSYYAGCNATSTSFGGYTTVTFSSVGRCNWINPDGVTKTDLIVVGGGGGGGDSASGSTGGSGGAGGYFSATDVAIPSAVEVLVGAGGQGGQSLSTQASVGGDSAFGTLKVGGGGGGNGNTYNTTRAGAGNGGTGYVSGGGGGGGNGKSGVGGTGGLGGLVTTITFNGNSFTGFAGANGANGDNNNSGGWGGSITASSRTSSISGSSVVYAKPGTYLPWGISANTNNPQTYGSGGSTNYTYSGSYGADPATGGDGYQGVIILKYASNVEYLYDLNSATAGSVPAGGSVQGGTSFTTAASTGIEKTNYSFAGWCTTPVAVGASCSGSLYGANTLQTMPISASSITLYAVWTGVAKTITYVNGGGSGTGPSSPSTVAYGSTFTTPANTFTRSGYQFSGWKDAANNTYAAGATYPSSGSVSADVTLTAQWTNCASGVVQSGLLMHLDAGSPCSTSGGTTWLDISGNSNNGTFSSTPTFGTDRGYYYTFATGKNPQLPAGFANFTSGISISFFANIGSSVYDFARIIDLNNSTSGRNNNIVVSVNSAANKVINIFFTNSAGTVTSECLSDNDYAVYNTWTHYAITIDSSKVCKFYRNGVLLKTDSSSITAFPTNISRAYNYVGRNSYSTTTIPGSLGDIAVYNSGLSASDVTTNYLSQTDATYTVTYNGNGNDGGTVPTDSNSPYPQGHTYRAAANSGNLTKTGYTFNWWCSMQPAAGTSCTTAGGTRYVVGNTPTMGTSNVTLYAIWNKNISITAANQTKTYTGSAVSVSNTVSLTSGTLNGSEALNTTFGTFTYAGINGTSYSASTTAPTAVGTYSITPSVAKLTNGDLAETNYGVTYVAGTLTINYTACNITWTSSGGYKYAQFKNSSPCSWTNDTSSTKFEVVIVGGGGGGGFGSNGGGGGAGEVLQTNTPLTINSSQVVHVTIGAGGASGAGPNATATNASSYGSEWRVGGNGTASTFGNVSANGGGGGGGNTNTYGQAGGSGGGGGYPSAIRTGGSTNKQTISGWDSFGFNGASSVTYYGGGGGGAGGAGSGRNGGASKTIWGYTLAAGGGGWGGTSGDTTLGGNGRTSASGYPYAGSSSTGYTSAGVANTGTGGGGGAPGGSGVVIIRYLDTVTITPTTSATSMNFGTASAYPTAGYTTSPSVTLTSEPTCNYYASSDTSFATPITLSSTTPVGNYVVKCTGGAYATTGANIAYGSNASFSVISNTQAALSLTSTSGTYGSTVSLTSSGGSGSGEVTYAVTSAGTAGCSISSTTLSATSAGACTVTVTKAADSTYAAISSNATVVTFGQASQTITFTKPADRKIGSGNFTVSPTSSSSLLVTVTSTTTDKCTVSGSTITLVAVGTCTLRSSQAGNTNYSAATAVDQSFAISAMTVTFYANYSGASPSSSTQSISTKDATALTSNSFTRVGYTFNGWNTVALGGGTSYTNSQSVTITDDLPIYAQWSAATITVTYKKGTNGTGSDIVDSFVYGNSLTLKDASAALTRTGYSISGWSTTDSATATITHALSLSYSDPTNLILYPVWSATAYTVTYKAGTGGSGSDILQSWSYPGPVTLKSAADAATLTKANYFISGWSTTDGGSKTNDLSGSYSTAGNLILYPVWSPSVYTITYSAATANSGSAAEATKSYTYGATGITLSLVGSMVKTGHDFAGWSTTSGGAANTTSPYTTSSDITLYAAWTPSTYQVIYNSNGGSTVSNGTFTYGGTTNAPTAPTRSGYVFNGWFEASTGGSALIFPYSPSGAENKTLYAQWSPVSYSITYAANGATGTVPTESNKNITNTFAAAAGTGLTKTGYDFAGWNDGTNSYAAGATYTVGAANVVLTAQWTKQTYTITYSANNGSGNASRTSDTYLYGSAAINLPTVGTLSRSGYTFGGWSETDSGSSISGAYTPTQTRTLYAVWSANTYTITYNSNGGGTAPSSGSYTTGGSTVTLPDGTGMAKTGYNFSGWSTTANGSVISSSGYTTSSNVTLYAIWTIKNINVTYAAGTVGGSASGVTMPSSTSGTYGSTITVSSTVDSYASSNTYAFAGWSDGSNIYAKGDSLRLGASDIVLTAQWVALYAVRYSATGGTFAAGDNSYDSECVAETTEKRCTSTQTITVNSSPTRTGYTFAGWKDQSGNAISSASYGWTISDSSYLAFATWTPVSYTVTYDSDGGSTAPTESNQNIGSLITVKPAVTKTGYTFIGWSTGGVTYGPGASYQIGSSNVTFTAIWSANSYNLSYDLNGGTSAVPSSTTKTYQQSVTTPGAPERAGYTFTNWSDGTTTVNHSSNYSMPASDTVLTAQWSVIDRTVTYNSNSGSTAPAGLTGKHIGETFTVGAAITRANYRFIGWSDGANTYLPGQSYVVGNGDITLSAVWSGQLYSVTYANGGGTGTLPTESTRENLETFIVASGATLSRSGYTFTKWNNGSNDFNPGDTYTMGSGAVTLTAQWSKNSITVTFKSNYTGSTSADTTQSFNADTDTSLTANAFTRTDYSFAGWNSKADGTGTSYTDTQTVNFLTSTTLFAKWSPSFTVQFESDGGSSVSSLTYTGSPLAKPSDPTKSGYNFGGWKKDSQSINWQYSPSQSVTLRAQWAAGVNTVTFNANYGSSPATATQDGITTDVPTVLNSPFARTNYALAGWAETSNGVKAFNPGANITLQGNKTLYALWTATGYAVTYDKNHAKATAAKSSENFAIGGTALKLPSASRPGFHFDGWFDAASGGNKLGDADADYSPSSDKTIYAQWTQLSLYGVPTNSLTSLGTVNAASGGSRSLSATQGASSVNISIPSGALPDGTVVSAKLVADLSRADGLISDPANFILSMVVSWLTADGEVPDTDASKPLTMTITNPQIKAGAAIYTILGSTVRLLGRATADGTATLSLYSDPEIVIGATVPDAPTSVTATDGADAQSVISWTAPASNGGSAITGYTVTSSPGGKTCSTSGATPATSCTVTGLSNGTSYTFTVTATNVVGVSSASSPSNSISPAGTSGISISTSSSGTYGTAQTITATVSGTEGSVNFKADGTSISGCSTISTSAGSASCTWIPGAINAAVSITAVFTPTSGSFTGATSSAVSVNVGKRSITIKAANKSAAYSGSSVSVTNSYSITSGSLYGSDALSGLTYTYTNSGSYNSNTAPSDSGSYTITPSSATFSSGSDINYTITYDTGTLTISANALTVTFGSAPSNVKLGSGTYSVGATSNPTVGNIVFGSNTTSVCTVDPTMGTLTILTSGTCTITADNSGDANHNAATQDLQSFSVSPITVTFDGNYTGASTATQSITTLNATALTSNSLNRTGYTFKDWNTLADGTGTTYTNGQSVSFTADTTLYATWTVSNSSSSNNSNNNSAPVPSPTTPARPVVPVAPEVVTPAEPVTKAADGTLVAENYNSAMTLIDGVAKEEKLTVIETTKVVTEALGIKLELQILNQEFKPIPVTNEVKLTLEHTGIAQFAGSGFKATTTVKVWLFSDPIYLGEYPVDKNGKFNASFLVLDHLPVGDHLLQINGVTGDSKSFSQSIPVVVKALDAVTPKPADPTNPEEPVTPVTPVVKKPLLSVYFKNTSSKIDSVIVSNFKKFAPKIKGAKTITCVAYKISSKYSTKLVNARAVNVCKYLKQRFGGAVKVSVLPISKAPTKSLISRTRNGRVDVLVAK